MADWCHYRLSSNLHDLIENVTLEELPNIVIGLKNFGGYFKRFRLPAAFKDIADRSTGEPIGSSSKTMLTLEQRVNMAFLKADVTCAQEEQSQADQPQADSRMGKRPVQVGSTGSIAIVQSRDSKPFWESEQYDIVVAHVGDTRYD
jgi:protein phosphatase PTC6